MDLLQGLALYGPVILLGLGLAYAAHRRKRSSAWLQTTGTIVSSQFNWVGGGLDLKVRYRYPVGGKTYTGTYRRYWRASLEAREELAEAMGQFAAGAAALVVYNPRRPEASGLGYRPANWVLVAEWFGWALSALGIVAVLTTILAQAA
ncbi:MAG: DUF3592 domain-containing protein [Dehalococcoidales bacterium]|nr:DUF3592 domain-containing protein [Dehalococcoidales bacterium]